MTRKGLSDRKTAAFHIERQQDGSRLYQAAAGCRSPYCTGRREGGRMPYWATARRPCARLSGSKTAAIHNWYARLGGRKAAVVHTLLPCNCAGVLFTHRRSNKAQLTQHFVHVLNEHNLQLFFGFGGYLSQIDLVLFR